MLCYEDESLSSPNQPTSLQVLFGPPGDTEGSSNSEGSHETGDSGRYSHDDIEMTNLSSGPSSRPASLKEEESGGSGCSPAQESEGELGEQSHLDLEIPWRNRATITTIRPQTIPSLHFLSSSLCDLPSIPQP